MSQPSGTERRHTAGALDIRNVIGGLLGVYGLVLLFLGIFDYTTKDSVKTGGINANLWAGLALIAVGAVFLAWAKLKPIVVPDHVQSPDDGRPAAG